MPTKVCKDCLAPYLEEVRLQHLDWAEEERRAQAVHRMASIRPANFPGPRCQAHHRKFIKVSKERAHTLAIAAQFNLSEEEQQALLEVQGGACGGCGKVPGPDARRMAVDHDHSCCDGPRSCGRCVRGFLCYDCNSTLATFRDDPELLRRLADYVENWPSWKLRNPPTEPREPDTAVFNDDGMTVYGPDGTVKIRIGRATTHLEVTSDALDID